MFLNKRGETREQIIERRKSKQVIHAPAGTDIIKGAPKLEKLQANYDALVKENERLLNENNSLKEAAIKEVVSDKESKTKENEVDKKL